MATAYGNNTKAKLEAIIACDLAAGMPADEPIMVANQLLLTKLNELKQVHNAMHIYGHGSACRTKNHPLYIKGAGLLVFGINTGVCCGASLGGFFFVPW